MTTQQQQQQRVEVYLSRFQKIVAFAQTCKAHDSYGIVKNDSGLPYLRLETKPNEFYMPQEAWAIKDLAQRLTSVGQDGKYKVHVKVFETRGRITVSYFD